MTTRLEDQLRNEYPLVRRLFGAKIEALDADRFELLLDPDHEKKANSIAPADPGPSAAQPLGKRAPPAFSQVRSATAERGDKSSPYWALILKKRVFFPPAKGGKDSWTT